MDAKTNAKTNTVSGAALKQAIESRNGAMLASFYADDATLRIIRSQQSTKQAARGEGQGGDRCLLG